ncbi:MAG: hypothetical protein JWR61_4403 [Ferruginibacter sp.]|nr:hypothetical protein [Ferruginibacter sp.]
MVVALAYKHCTISYLHFQLTIAKMLHLLSKWVQLQIKYVVLLLI